MTAGMAGTAASEAGYSRGVLKGDVIEKPRLRMVMREFEKLANRALA